MVVRFEYFVLLLTEKLIRGDQNMTLHNEMKTNEASYIFIEYAC